jgi:hypothetical protein
MLQKTFIYIKREREREREREDERFSQSVIRRSFGIINIYFPALRRLDNKKHFEHVQKIKSNEKKRFR